MNIWKVFLPQSIRILTSPPLSHQTRVGIHLSVLPWTLVYRFPVPVTSMYLFTEMKSFSIKIKIKKYLLIYLFNHNKVFFKLSCQSVPDVKYTRVQKHQRPSREWQSTASRLLLRRPAYPLFFKIILLIQCLFRITFYYLT